MSEVLDSTRKIMRMLRNDTAHSVSYMELSVLAGSILRSNVILADCDGNLLGLCEDDSIPVMDETISLDELHIEDDFSSRLLGFISTRENIRPEIAGLASSDDYYVLVVPIYMSEERMGTIFFYRLNDKYDNDDILIGEYVSIIAGVQMLNDEYKQSKYVVMESSVVDSAIAALSFSELEAIRHVFYELNYMSGMIRTNAVSDKYSITRSIIINAVKKLAGAGVIRSRSHGTKGTQIDIINEKIIDVIKTYR